MLVRIPQMVLGGILAAAGVSHLGSRRLGETIMTSAKMVLVLILIFLCPVP